MQVGRTARLAGLIGPAVQLRDEAGKARGDIYQLNGVERGQSLGLLLEQRAEATADHVLLQVRQLSVNRDPFRRC